MYPCEWVAKSPIMRGKEGSVKTNDFDSCQIGQISTAHASKHKCQINKLRVKRGRDGVETVSPTGGNNKQIIIKVTHGRSDPIVVIHVVGVSRYPCNFHVFQRLGDTFGAAQKLKQDQEVKTHQQEMRVLFANTLILK